MSAPEISVVVPSLRRPVRLRWLLNALEEQTLDRGRWEVVVATTGETATVAAEHSVGARVVAAESTGAAAQRNAGWRAAGAPVVLFTDDDCRPPREWLEHALVAATENPGAVIQGATRPDPDELEIARHAPHARTLHVQPPTPWGETCNMLYPRDVLERLGGFDESFAAAAAEDTDLLQRAIASGLPVVAAPDVLTFHCVEAVPLHTRLRGLWRWRFQAALVKRHPHLREPMPLGIFWKHSHALLAVALAGAPLARRHPLVALTLAVPWAREAMPSYGDSPRGRLRAVSELPGRAAIDAVEMAAVARGAIAERTLLL